MAEFVSVGNLADLPVGKGKAFEVGDRIIAIFNDQGTLFAIDDMCPHMGASLASGELEDSAVACPWHGWRFDVRDGSWCDNRRLKTDSFEVRVVDDRIEVATEPIPKAEDDLTH